MLSSALADVAQRLRASTVDVNGPRRASGGGAGVIWRADGLVITNAHVARWRRGHVMLPGRGMCEAELVGRDPERDLAALQLDARDLVPAPIGDSTRLRVGELVFAVGSPLGMLGAVTSGIVYAVGPAHRRGSHEWVQADLRLMPGNSGGPLADALGRVVGINSMIAGGLALAVPSAAVQAFLAPYLGQSAPAFAAQRAGPADGDDRVA